MVLTAKSGYRLDIVNWPRLSNPNGEGSRSGSPECRREQFLPAHIESIIIPMTTRYSQLFVSPIEKNGFATLNGRFVWGGDGEPDTYNLVRTAGTRASFRTNMLTSGSAI